MSMGPRIGADISGGDVLAGPESRPTPLADLLALSAEVAERCRAAGRPDLAEHLLERRASLSAPFVCVVVAGDYKAGKSTLVNALVGAEICPVDDDEATVVPTLVSYADEPTVVVRFDDGHPDNGEPDGTGPPRRQAVPFAELGAYASESGNPGNARRVRTVEVGLPSPLLRAGIVLVDTPGVGGIGSEYSAATLASLGVAHALLFVSDATQEYTAPELEFLAAARQRCPLVVPVLTKVDLFPDWKRIRAGDQTRLARAEQGHTGAGGEVLAVAAELSLFGRRQARNDLQAESGLDALVEELRHIGDRGWAIGAATLAAGIHAATGQLAAPLRAERNARADPTAVLAELAAAEEDGRHLARGGAEWLAILDDGMVELDHRIDREMGRRLLDVQREADTTLAALDPAGPTWEEFSATLTRRAAAAVATASELLVEGANRLAESIADSFMAHESVIAPKLIAAQEAQQPGSLSLGRSVSSVWKTELVDAGWGGMEAMGTLAGMLSIAVFNPVSLVVGALMSGRTLRHARQREIEQRREQARDAIIRYLEEVRRDADRERVAALHRVRRELRTAYQRRAEGLYRSARESLAAARRAIDTAAAEHGDRPAEVAGALDELRRLDERADDLASAAAELHPADR